MVDFVSWREATECGRFLKNLLVESRLNNTVSYARNGRYLLCKKRGLLVKEDNNLKDADDNGSITTLASNVDKRPSRTGSTAKVSDVALTDTIKSVEQDGRFPQSLPRLLGKNGSHQRDDHGCKNIFLFSPCSFGDC